MGTIRAPGAALVAVLIVLLTACSSTTGGSPVSTPVPTSGGSSSTSPVPSSGGSSSSSPVPSSGGSSSSSPSSTPSAHTVTATVTRSAPPAGSPGPSSGGTAAVPAGFVGTWTGHGRDLVVRADGRVSLGFRLYTLCTARRTTHCDRIDDNGEIHEGGQVTARVVQAINATTVDLRVTATSEPASVPLGTVRLGHDLTHHAVAIFGGGLNGTPFCGPGAPVGYCGA